jgi:hypothetical protein
VSTRYAISRFERTPDGSTLGWYHSSSPCRYRPPRIASKSKGCRCSPETRSQCLAAALVPVRRLRTLLPRRPRPRRLRAPRTRATLTVTTASSAPRRRNPHKLRAAANHRMATSIQDRASTARERVAPISRQDQHHLRLPPRSARKSIGRRPHPHPRGKLMAGQANRRSRSWRPKSTERFRT